MSVFSNKIGLTDSNKVLKLSEKQIFENDYERLKNKFNFGNINLNKNINSFPLRLSSPNYNETNSNSNSKNEPNNHVNSHKICYNYATKKNKDNIEQNNCDKIHNFIKKNNILNSNCKPESRNTSITNNLYKLESITPKSKEKLIVNYNIKQNYNDNILRNKKNSYVKKEYSTTTDGKNRRTANTHASTDFRFSDKSIDMTSSNNSFISHSFLNNINNNFNNKNSQYRYKEEIQIKDEKDNYNSKLKNYMKTNNTNINTQSTSLSILNTADQNEKENIKKCLTKNNSISMIHSKKLNSNIIAYNNFNKCNKTGFKKSDKSNNVSTKNGIININTSSYKSLSRNDNCNRDNTSYLENKSVNATKSVNISINLSRGGTTTLKKFNEKNNKMKSSTNYNKNFHVRQINDNKSDSNLFKITDIKFFKTNNNQQIEPENVNMINKIFDAEIISKNHEFNKELFDNNKQSKNNSSKSLKILENKLVNYYQCGKGNDIFDDTERKTDRNLNNKHIQNENDDENDLAFANALEDLSQSNESSINELIQPLNKKINTISSQNIPSEENVESNLIKLKIEFFF